MKTREEIEKRAKRIDGTFPGISGVTHMLAIAVELLLDIRELMQNKQ